jgi:hypothetical protein
MPLSIAKLQEFLSSKGFVPNKYFIIDGSCFYIELFCLKTADIFLLYIPSKYDIRVRPDSNVYKIKYIDMGSSDNLTDEYAGKPDNLDIENAYGNMQVHLSPDKDKMEEHLESNYRHAISLNDISKDDTTDLKGVYRQLKRLKYCVQNLKYKLAIIFKNYLCSIRRDDSIDCFAVKNYPREDCKQLLVIIDLETFYEKNEKLVEDIYVVRQSIYRVLERNQNMHGQVMEKIMENRKDIISIPQLVEIKKNKYDAMITQLEEMLKIMSEAEKKVMDQLYELKQNNTDGLQNDIDRVHHKSRLEKELDKINSIRGSISKHMFILREKRENAILSVDKIMFDNTVMFDSMVKNFAKLKDFC